MPTLLLAVLFAQSAPPPELAARGWQVAEVDRARVATAQSARLPLGLAAGTVDGLSIANDDDLALWSFLVDHGFALAPVGARTLVHGEGGVHRGHTVATTGPWLAVAAADKSEIAIEAWAQAGDLQRVELWAQNKVLATHAVPAEGARHVTMKLAFPGAWAAVRVVAADGWALSHAFFAEPIARPAPVATQFKMVFPEIASQQQAGALATVFSGPPDAAGTVRLKEIELQNNELTVEVPPLAVVRVELADGRSIDLSPAAASGVLALLSQHTQAPRDWGVYEEVRRRLQRVALESRF